MEFKDRKFKFMDSVWTVRFVDRVELLEDQDPTATNFGLCDADRRTITIGLKDADGKSYPKEQVLKTLRHELMHMIMFEGQYVTCFNDEPLVEWLAKSIGLLLKQRVLE